MTQEQLPTLGGIYTHTHQEINERAVAISCTYVQGQGLDDFLAMDWGQMEAMILGNTEAVPGMQTVRYDRTRFVVQLNETAPPAGADVLIANDYEPTTEDVRWLLDCLAEGISLCLTCGVDSPQGLWARALARLRMGSMSIDLEPFDPWLNSPTFANAFQGLPVSAGPPVWEGEARPEGAQPEWRNFFSDLEQIVAGIMGLDEARDGDEIAAGPEPCWRCEAKFAASPVGLCDDCRIDLKADQ